MSAGEGEIATSWQGCAIDPANDDLRHRLRLEFDWQQDRHWQRLWRDIETAGHLSSELLLASVEGTAEHRWPASPPLQSLAFENRGEQTVALAVGMAGGAHWSASIETLPEPLALRFDYACRLNEEADFLGTTFKLMTAAAELLEVNDLVGGVHESSADQLRIVADPAVRQNSVLTARWRFTLRYTLPAG